MSPSIQFIVNLRANMKLAAVCLLIAASVALAAAQGTMHCRVPICDNHDGTLTFWPDPEPRTYWVCILNSYGDWGAFQQRCSCGYYFDFTLQACIPPESWSPTCTEVYNPFPCIAEAPLLQKV